MASSAALFPTSPLRQSLHPHRRSTSAFLSGPWSAAPTRIQRFPRTLVPVRSSPPGSHIDSPEEEEDKEEEVRDLGVMIALPILRFYRSEISPFLLPNCRFVPSCSVYSMEAYKRYSFAKGTVLTAWRLCRCNPFGGSGYDPPRWFGEESPNGE